MPMPKVKMLCSCHKTHVWATPVQTRNISRVDIASVSQSGRELQARQRSLCQGSVDSLCRAVLQRGAPQTRCEALASSCKIPATEALFAYKPSGCQPKSKHSPGYRQASRMGKAVNFSCREKPKLPNHTADAFGQQCGRVAPMVAKI